MITFIKILSYDTGSKNLNLDYVNGVLEQKVDPDTLEPNSLKSMDSVTYYSPLKRCENCIKMQARRKYIQNELLREIPFSLGNIPQGTKDLSSFVRSVFIDKFINDRLLISRQTLLDQTKKILEFNNGNDNITMISHTFRLKIIELYLQVGDTIFKEPKLISQFINPSKKIYEFGHSFKA
jgi:hypothetical protein